MVSASNWSWKLLESQCIWNKTWVMGSLESTHFFWMTWWVVLVWTKNFNPSANTIVYNGTDMERWGECMEILTDSASASVLDHEIEVCTCRKYSAYASSQWLITRNGDKLHFHSSFCIVWMNHEPIKVGRLVCKLNWYASVHDSCLLLHTTFHWKQKAGFSLWKVARSGKQDFKWLRAIQPPAYCSLVLGCFLCWAASRIKWIGAI